MTLQRTSGEVSLKALTNMGAIVTSPISPNASAAFALMAGWASSRALHNVSRII